MLFDVYNYFIFVVYIGVHTLIIVTNTYFIIRFSIDLKQKFPMFYEKMYWKLWVFFGILILIMIGRLILGIKAIIGYNHLVGIVLNWVLTIVLFMSEIVPSFMLMISYMFLRGGQQTVDIDQSERSSDALNTNGESIKDSMLFRRDPDEEYTDNASIGPINKSKSGMDDAHTEDMSNSSLPSDVSLKMDRKQSEIALKHIQRNTSEFPDKVTFTDQERGEISNSPYKKHVLDSLDTREGDLKFALNQMMSDLGMERDNQNMKSSDLKNSINSVVISMNSSITSSNYED